MNTQDIKLILINSFSFGLSLTTLESGLKIVLLLASIIYTILKIYGIYISGKNK